jgi:diphosphomevalonate decarboxylase
VKKSDVVKSILGDRYLQKPSHHSATSFAPTNIALVKYWGKREQEINLPVTSSLSISLDNKGAKTSLSLNDKQSDVIILNNQLINESSVFARRLVAYLDLFRTPDSMYLDINIEANIPVAAGLASSACGFAALAQVLNKLYGWKLSLTQLSVLARLGSGSACRSLWDGFVEWQAGLRSDGMDSYGVPLEKSWPEFRIGLLIMQEKEKALSSREAMQRTVMTSPLYPNWTGKVDQDLPLTKYAIQNSDFELLGKTAESNAMTMHALMLSAWPPISYALPETMASMHKIWKLRQEGLLVYFTQDAGPNLKLLFLEKNLTEIKTHFPNIEVITPF